VLVFRSWTITRVLEKCEAGDSRFWVMLPSRALGERCSILYLETKSRAVSISSWLVDYNTEERIFY
jgi:hypothetical protein